MFTKKHHFTLIFGWTICPLPWQKQAKAALMWSSLTPTVGRTQSAPASPLSPERRALIWWNTSPWSRASTPSTSCLLDSRSPKVPMASTYPQVRHTADNQFVHVVLLLIKVSTEFYLILNHPIVDWNLYLIKQKTTLLYV